MMYLLPQPSSLRMEEGTFLLHYQSRIFMDAKSDDTLYDAALLLQEEIQASTGFPLAIIRRHATKEPGMLYLTTSSALPKEAYTLSITPEGITICGSPQRGVLYGVQTLRQIIRQNGAVLPCLEISDAPAMENRGFYHDATRGRVPTLAYLKHLADTLSYYKINQLQLYIEHSYLFDDLTEMWRDDTPLTAEDILELDRYCKKLGIDLVPSLASFGHLYKLLCTKSYAHLCELEGSDQAPFSFYDRQAHHTLDITNPESFELVKQLLLEYMQLFSSPYFNLCADETFDLGKGAAKALAEEKGTTVIYTEFLTRLADFITSCGKTPMFWSDVISQEPEVYHLLPKNLICLHWDYAADVSSERLDRLTASGAKHLYVCPGVQGWNQLINQYHTAYENISRMAGYGHNCHAMGLLNTDWGDFGHINHPEFSRIGMIYGAACSWNSHLLPEEELNRQISVLEFGDPSGTIVSLLATLSQQDAFPWHKAVLVQEALELKKDTDEAASYVRACSSASAAETNARIDQLSEKLSGFAVQIRPENRSLLYAYLLAADGLKNLNRLLPVLRASLLSEGELPVKEEAFALASDLERWLYQYKNLWRTVSKESELYRISHVFCWYADYLRSL